MSLEIINYTEKSCVVRGDTKPHKDSLKNMGGKWNSNLTDKDTGGKFGGWIFPMTRHSRLEQWESADYPEVEEYENTRSSGKKSPVAKSNKTEDSEVVALRKRVEVLEKQVTQLLQQKEEEDDEEEDEEETVVPLLRTKSMK